MSNLEFVFAIASAILVVTTATLILVKLFARDAGTREALLFTTICLSLATPMILLAVDYLGLSVGIQVRHAITRIGQPIVEPEPFLFESTGLTEEIGMSDFVRQSESGGPAVITTVEEGSFDAAAKVALSSDLPKWLVSAWAIVSAFLLLRVGWAWRKLGNIVARSIPLVDTPAQRALNNASQLVRFSPATSLHASGETSVPIAVGILCPKVLLPPTWNQLTDDQLTDVLVHELTHLARRDPFKLMLQQIAAALYWPIVTLHFVNWQLNSAREEVCDNGVLTHRDAISYGETLLRVATIATSERNLNLASVGFLRKQCNLAERISAVVATDRIRGIRPSLPKLFPICGVLAFLVAAVCALVANPQSTATNDTAAVVATANEKDINGEDASQNEVRQLDPTAEEAASATDSVNELAQLDREGAVNEHSNSMETLFALSRAYESARKKYSDALYSDDPELQERADDLYPDDEFIPEFLELEETVRGQEVGFQALRYLIGLGRSHGNRDSAASIARVAAFALVEKFYADHPDADSCLSMNGGVPFRSAESLFGKLRERSPHSHVRAAAWFYFAEWQFEMSQTLEYARYGLNVDLSTVKPSVRKFYEEVLRFDDVGVEDLRANAISAAEHVVQHYSDERQPSRSYSGPLGVLQVRDEAGKRYSPFGVRADALLKQIRHLAPGSPAPEITGKDADGTTFRLSDYRGRIVVLMFSGNWCGPCKGRYPGNRELKYEYQDQPVEILGIATDKTIDTVREAHRKGEVTWRVWWDGGRDGPIAKQWNVTSYPTFVILDHNGIIRHRRFWTGSLMEAVGKLLEERAADANAGTLLGSHPIPEIPTLEAARAAANKLDQKP